MCTLDKHMPLCYYIQEIKRKEEVNMRNNIFDINVVNSGRLAPGRTAQ